MRYPMRQLLRSLRRNMFSKKEPAAPDIEQALAVWTSSPPNSSVTGRDFLFFFFPCVMRKQPRVECGSLSSWDYVREHIMSPRDGSRNSSLFNAQERNRLLVRKAFPGRRAVAEQRQEAARSGPGLLLASTALYSHLLPRDQKRSPLSADILEQSRGRTSWPNDAEAFSTVEHGQRPIDQC